MPEINNTRSEQMRQRMLILKEKGLCLLCNEGLELFQKTKLFEGKYWYVTLNDAPLKGAITHVMAVPNRHILHPKETTTDERNELFEVVIPWLEDHMKMEGLSTIMRFGKTERTGSTIHHLHVHFVEGVDRSSLDHEPIWAVVGFQKAAQQPT